MIKEHYKKEIAPPSSIITKGDTGEIVKNIQEWLNLWRYYSNRWQLQILIDGDYGSITENAVRKFQQFRTIDADGIVGRQTWQELTKPMRRAFEPIVFFDTDTLRTRVIDYARKHLNSHPTEFHPNQGPWVRAYMGGRDGEMWMWCVGFMETILDCAFSSMGKKFTDYFPKTFLAGAIHKHGKENGTLVTNAELKAEKYIPQPGDIFLNMNSKNPEQAYHVGFVLECKGDVFTTIEGNTSAMRGQPGTQVGMHSRNYKKYLIDIVKLEK